MQEHAISPAGFQKLKAEWEDLKHIQRPAMIKQVQDAAAEGDRSENAAYTYGKMRVREIDRRLRYLDKLLDSAVVLDKPPQALTGEVAFGAVVKVRQIPSGQEREYQFVGGAEIDPMLGKISLKSPIGLALKGHKAGTKVTVSTPKGPQELEILSVEYGDTAPSDPEAT
jgi:transcription elongation factor GreB